MNHSCWHFTLLNLSYFTLLVKQLQRSWSISFSSTLVQPLFTYSFAVLSSLKCLPSPIILLIVLLPKFFIIQNLAYSERKSNWMLKLNSSLILVRLDSRGYILQMIFLRSVFFELSALGQQSSLWLSLSFLNKDQREMKIELLLFMLSQTLSKQGHYFFDSKGKSKVTQPILAKAVNFFSSFDSQTKCMQPFIFWKEARLIRTKVASYYIQPSTSMNLCSLLLRYLQRILPQVEISVHSCRNKAQFSLKYSQSCPISSKKAFIYYLCGPSLNFYAFSIYL